MSDYPLPSSLPRNLEVLTPRFKGEGLGADNQTGNILIGDPFSLSVLSCLTSARG